MNGIQQNIYIQRVNRVLDHITSHLNDELPLKTLASIASFSEFHFHRIFKSVVGETVNQFVWRMRVERGAALMRAKPEMKISDVAAESGFTSLAGYSRAFKTRYGLAPTQWDRQTPLQSEQFACNDQFPMYRISELQRCQDEFTVNFRQMPAQRLAYVRVYDAYHDKERIEAAYQRLFAWYRTRGGRLEDTTLYGMSQDDRDITPEALCRFDWCLHVPDDWQGDNEISVRNFPACLLATIKLDGGDLQVEDRIWQYFWRYWLPRSQFQPMDLPAMEIYHRFPSQESWCEAEWWDSFYLDCAVPVMRL